MTPRLDASAETLEEVESLDAHDIINGNVIRLSEEDFLRGSREREEDEESLEEFYHRTAKSGKLDAGRTVRSGLAYDLDSTDPVPPRDAERAAGVKAELGDEPLHGIERRYAYRFIKRTFDILFSAAVIVVFSWLFLIIAIAIKVDDPNGPVLFKQRRLGWSTIGQKSGVASVNTLRPAFSALEAFDMCHLHHRMGVAA